MSAFSLTEHFLDDVISQYVCSVAHNVASWTIYLKICLTIGICYFS